MKIEKYALLDTDFISKTHFIHGDTEKCLVDLVVEMPGYCFFCHSQIIKELSRHNQQAIGWLRHKISEQKIQCYTDEEILNELVKIRGDFACSTYTLMLKDACDAFSKSYFKEHYQTLENFDVVTSTKQDYLETLQKADDEIGKHNSMGEIKSYVLLQLLSLLKGEQVYVFCSDDKAARNGAISFNNVRCAAYPKNTVTAGEQQKPRRALTNWYRMGWLGNLMNFRKTIIRIIFRHSRDGYLLESMRMRASAAHLWNTEKGCSS